MCNVEIREALEKAHLKQWQLADLLEISEATMYRKLRREFPEERKAEILELIRKNAR